MARSKLEGGLLTYEQAAGYLAVGRTTMYDLVGKGDLPTVKIRRCTRFRVEDLDALYFVGCISPAAHLSGREMDEMLKRKGLRDQ